MGGGIGIPIPMGMPIMTFPMLGGSLALLGLRELTREERGYRGAMGQQDCNIHEEAVHVPPLPLPCPNIENMRKWSLVD